MRERERERERERKGESVGACDEVLTREKRSRGRERVKEIVCVSVPR